MKDIDKYLLLDEERNAMDFLMQSLTFLSQVEQNRYYLKWFIIAFHGAVHAFILLTLQGVDSQQIYEPDRKQKEIKKRVSKGKYGITDNNLLRFVPAYNLLKKSKNMAGRPFIALKTHDMAIGELNNKLRNQFIHFRPMVWAAEPWYPARVCQPLIDVLVFCVKSENVKLGEQEKQIALTYLDSIKVLLDRHAI